MIIGTVPHAIHSAISVPMLIRMITAGTDFLIPSWMPSSTSFAEMPLKRALTVRMTMLTANKAVIGTL